MSNSDQKNKDEAKNEATNCHCEEGTTCPHCGSEDIYGISRVVGYFSIIDNWNKSKKAELERRKKGTYWP